MESSFSNIRLLFIFLLVLTSFSIKAQDGFDEEEQDSSGFYIGGNLGAFFSNNETAVIYNGSASSTPFGVSYILNLPRNQQAFNDFFRHPYVLSELPVESTYRTTSEIGLHVGYQFNNDISVFAEINASNLSYEQVFTIAIDDPNNQMVGPTLEQFPIIGEETRFNLNIGAHFSLYNENRTNFYFSLFANINDVELDRNFIIINNVRYEIFHQDFNNPNFRPGGVGYGGGSGLGLRFPVTDRILSDLYYNLYYTQTNLREELQPFGVHNSLGIRVLWTL